MDIKIVGGITLLCLIWGYLWVIIKLSLQTFPPFLFSSLRLLFGALALLLLQALLRKSILPKQGEWGKLTIASLLLCIGFYGGSTFGMQYVGSGISAVLVYTMPIMIGILAHYFLNEKLTFNKTIGLLMGTIGLVFILWPELKQFKFNQTLFGELLLIIAALSWAGSTVYIKKYLASYDKIKLTLWQMLIGGVILFVVALVTEPVTQVHWNTPINIFYVFYSAVLGTGVAFAVWNWIISKIDASVASISIMSVPLLGLLFGHLQLGEALHQNILFGAIFICIGILFSSMKVNMKIGVKSRKSI
ncbi:DMT family transporter [Acinetobacter gerneri]|uniref:DMT family transporter n=1 Tax=Acinetobacter gerneri TaxID=202952 RepID=UPI0032120523